MSASYCDVSSFKSFTWKNLHLLKQENLLTEDLSRCQIGLTDVRINEVSDGVSSVPKTASEAFIDAWDINHVKLPCSPQNLYADDDQIVTRWSVIQRALSGSIDSTETFEKVILSYNRKYEPYWDVGSLSAALQKRPDFRSLLKKIADLALRLPELVTQPIPLLRQNKEMSLSLSQLQIACLLANAFYCTFPQRTSPGAESEYRNFPTINFISLFCTSTARTAGTLNSPGRMVKGKASSIKIEKLICLLHYFSRVLGEDGPPTGVVTFSRRCLEKPPDFESSEVLIGSVPFGTSPSCLIEDADGDNIHVDFANRFLGGGVLRWGCVQEEIMCVIKPEMLVGRLFLESLLPHEAALVFGAERFSNYTGYSGSFKWAGDFREAEHCESRDAAGRWKKVTAVIDAVRFTNPRVQFQKSFIQRELNKV
uniref:poly(ADP-ribose) glycohydrolase n=1 Tax=Schistocephalus solidus TaxID=70667 RepID=A0A0X3NIX6_SCHSO